MATQLQFYENVAPVSVERHRDLYVKNDGNYSFANKSTAVLLTSTEFAHAAQEYAIVFAGDEATPLPVVVLGAGPGENLYVDDDNGRWDGRYVPAFVRRYPFVFANAGDDSNRLALCVDEDYAGCNREGRGERLFDADGERTAYLSQVLNFQQAFQVEHQRTQAFAKRLAELELLEPVQAQIRAPDGKSRVLTGMRAVNREKLRAVADDAMLAMARSGELELIHLHLHSLNNLRVIGERLPKDAMASSDAASADESAGSVEDAAAH